MAHTSQTAQESYRGTHMRRDPDEERDPVLGLAIRCVERAELRSANLDALRARILLAVRSRSGHTSAWHSGTVNAATGDRGCRPEAI